MRHSRMGDDLPVSFARDDEETAGEFDRPLAGYLRRHREGWDVTAIVESLQLLGGKTRQVDVHVRRRPAGRLAVTIQFEHEPGEATAGRMRPANRFQPDQILSMRYGGI